MNFKYITAKALKKTGINKLLYPIKKPFLMQKTVQKDLTEAEHLLEQANPNNGKTCHCTRNFNEIEYDCCIIIPVYNAAATITKCLDSCFRQKTSFSYQIICINDGSNDNSLAILNSFADKITILDQDNSGAAHARNRGLDLNSAKYIMFVDADDFLPENALEDLLTCAIEHNADIVEGSALTLNYKGKKIGQFSHPNKKTENFYELSGFPWMKVFNRNLFKNVSFPENYWYEDSVLKLILYPLAKKIYTIDSNVYVYLTTKNNTSHTSITKAKCIDALYCLLSLHYEREKYGISCNQNYYEYMLETAKLMYLRTMYSKENIKIAIFIIYADYICEQFRGYKSKNNIDLETAFRDKNYKLYKTICEL